MPTSPPSALLNETDDPGASGTSKKRKFHAFASDNNPPSKRCVLDGRDDDCVLTFAYLSLPSTQKKRKADRSDDDSILPSDIQWETYLLHFPSEF